MLSYFVVHTPQAIAMLFNIFLEIGALRPKFPDYVIFCDCDLLELSKLSILKGIFSCIFFLIIILKSHFENSFQNTYT